MSRRTPFPFADHHDPHARDKAMNDVITTLIEEYEDALANEFGPSADADVVFYHEGRRALSEELLVDLLAVPHSLMDAYWGVTTPPATTKDAE